MLPTKNTKFAREKRDKTATEDELIDWWHDSHCLAWHTWTICDVLKTATLTMATNWVRVQGICNLDNLKSGVE